MTQASIAIPDKTVTAPTVINVLFKYILERIDSTDMTDIINDATTAMISQASTIFSTVSFVMRLPA